MRPSSSVKRVYRLEMQNADQLRGKPLPDALEIRQVVEPCPALNWFLHQAVGVDYSWGGREHWNEETWTQYAARPELETWVAYTSGTPAGYFELERQQDGSVRIVCFGLLGSFFGRGFGAPLLTAAVRRCWKSGANRVWLTTCSHDHERALPNYLARGFEVMEEIEAEPNHPRLSVLFTTGAFTD